MSTRPNLDDFPDSVYAAELRKDGIHLRFPERLEERYLDQHVEHVTVRVRAWTAVVTMIGIVFSVDQLVEEGFWTPMVLAHLFGILPTVLVMTTLAWLPGRMRTYLKVASVLQPIYVVPVSAAVADAMAAGFAEEIVILLLIVIGAFFFMGLLFRASLVTAVSAFLSFAVFAIMSGVATALIVKASLLVAVGLLLGVTIGRDVERSYRKQFLEQSLISELADRDGLTGLKNRRAYDEHLLRVWRHALRENDELALVMIDIDYFKPYNDRYGHQAGDATLRKVADALKEFARRPLDIVARFGGEEFTIILYDIRSKSVHDILEHMRIAVERLGIKHEGSECAPHVTISVGAAIAQAKIGRTPQELLQLADEALYEAKGTGRNCCVIRKRDADEVPITGSSRHSRADGVNK